MLPLEVALRFGIPRAFVDFGGNIWIMSHVGKVLCRRLLHLVDFQRISFFERGGFEFVLQSSDYGC